MYCTDYWLPVVDSSTLPLHVERNMHMYSISSTSTSTGTGTCVMVLLHVATCTCRGPMRGGGTYPLDIVMFKVKKGVDILLNRLVIVYLYCLDVGAV